MPNPGRTAANVQPPPNPAQAGNARAATHHAFRAKVVGPRARELARSILEANPHLDPVRDRAAVLRYAVLLARIERVYLWLSRQSDDVFSDAPVGEVHAVFERLEKWEAGAERAEDRLAIAPLTRARLGPETARLVDAATALSEPDPDRRRELMLEAGLQSEARADE